MHKQSQRKQPKQKTSFKKRRHLLEYLQDLGPKATRCKCETIVSAFYFWGIVFFLLAQTLLTHWQLFVLAATRPSHSNAYVAILMHWKYFPTTKSPIEILTDWLYSSIWYLAPYLPFSFRLMPFVKFLIWFMKLFWPQIWILMLFFVHLLSSLTEAQI